MRRVAVLACLCALAVGVPIASASGGGSDGKRTRGSDSASRLCGLDKEFLKESMEGDIFEIRGGRIALRKSHNAAVVRLANRLIVDHSKTLADAQALARRFGVSIPTEPSPSEQWELAVVSRMSERDFNHWYSALEVKDHMQDISLAEDEIKDGCSADVIMNARSDLPILRLHLMLAQEALRANP